MEEKCNHVAQFFKSVKTQFISPRHHLNVGLIVSFLCNLIQHNIVPKLFIDLAGADRHIMREDVCAPTQETK